MPSEVKRLTKLTKQDKQELWVLLDDGTKAGLKTLAQRYNGPVRHR